MRRGLDASMGLTLERDITLPDYANIGLKSQAGGPKLSP